MHGDPKDTNASQPVRPRAPTGYLDGFTNPSGRRHLCVFDRHLHRWFDTGAAGVGAIKGFYDYPPGSVPDQTADEAFAGLETKFPVVRSELLAREFSGWVKELEFLLTFAQMLRARTELFREQDLAHTRELTFLKVERVLQSEPSTTKRGRFGTSLKVGPWAIETQAQRETLLRNKTITDMRAEIAKGPAWMSQLCWCLRVTGEPSDPVIAADNPVVVEGKAPTLAEALRDGATLVFFPICWQACLIGSVARFDKETDAFHPSDLGRLRALYVKSARRFVFSPVCLHFR